MDPLRIDAGERSADDIISALEDGRRVVVAAEMFGSDYELTLRHDGETYYCDTPTTLHKHDDQAEMRQCIRNMGYGTGE